MTAISVRILTLYTAVLLPALALALKCFSVSMDEPFTKVTVHELVWQLMVPSSLLTVSLVASVGMCFVATTRLLQHRFTVSVAVLILCIVLLASESIYGYLWDLRSHAGIQ